MTKRLQTIQEVSEHSGLLVSFLRKMVFERTIPFVKIGKRIYFDRDEINQWIDGHKVVA